MIITIDGPAASGKSSVAQALAEHYGLSYLGTGYLYRAAAYLLYANKPPVMREMALSELEQLRSLRYTYTAGKVAITFGDTDVFAAMHTMPHIDTCASLAGADAAVRAELLQVFRAYAAEHAASGIVADGRDCGTVIFPQATVKFFLTASPHARAQRIFADPSRHNKNQSLETIEHTLSERDRRDSTRRVAPLVPAVGAIIIDNSALSLQETIVVMVDYVDSGCN